MSYTQDKAHSSALLGAITSGEKELQKSQQQQQQPANTSSDSASIFSTSSFGSVKALLKKHKPSKSNKSSSSNSNSGTPSEAELLRMAQRNQARNNRENACVQALTRTRSAWLLRVEVRGLSA
ncbi:hypothetical protein GGR54DRAFT_638187 [Hypoxylon sp. NC1633]|nr:hypothetical protein GGR54DRAFT_638187 [Hypoxylon sp. NC1633]